MNKKVEFTLLCLVCCQPYPSQQQQGAGITINGEERRTTETQRAECESWITRGLGMETMILSRMRDLLLLCHLYVPRLLGSWVSKDVSSQCLSTDSLD